MAPEYKENSIFPRSVMLEMSYECNHSCVFCSCPWYSPRGDYLRGEPLSVERYERLLKELAEGRGVSHFTLTGGEPLLFGDLRRLIKYISGLSVVTRETAGNGESYEKRQAASVSIVTNGALLDDGWLSFLAAHNVALMVSLPGLSTYALHTRSKHIDAKGVLKLIEKASGLKVPVTAAVTVTRANFFEAYETMAEALLSGASFLLVNRFLPGGRGLGYLKELMLDPSMTAEMLEMADEVLRLSKRRGAVGTEIPACAYGAKKFDSLDARPKCGAASEFFAIDPAGFVRVCSHSDKKIATIEELRLLEGDPAWRAYAARDHIPAECAGCGETEYCHGGCRAAAELFAGDARSVDPAFRFYGGCPKPFRPQ